MKPRKLPISCPNLKLQSTWSTSEALVNKTLRFIWMIAGEIRFQYGAESQGNMCWHNITGLRGLHIHVEDKKYKRKGIDREVISFSHLLKIWVQNTLSLSCDFLSCVLHDLEGFLSAFV